jgi:ubiquinone/menaquinone biosynthesis C-methylase UbiE
MEQVTSDTMISLDVGCGTNPKGDVNIDVIREAQHNLLADAHHLPLRNNSISVIFCDRLLEHLDNPDLALKEINRVLTVEGSAEIEVPKPFFANNCRFHFFHFLVESAIFYVTNAS